MSKQISCYLLQHMMTFLVVFLRFHLYHSFVLRYCICCALFLLFYLSTRFLSRFICLPLFLFFLFLSFLVLVFHLFIVILPLISSHLPSRYYLISFRLFLLLSSSLSKIELLHSTTLPHFPLPPPVFVNTDLNLPNSSSLVFSLFDKQLPSTQRLHLYLLPSVKLWLLVSFILENLLVKTNR